MKQQNIQRAIELAQQIITLLQDTSPPPFPPGFLEAEERARQADEDRAEARAHARRAPILPRKCENCDHLGGRWPATDSSINPNTEWKCFKEVDSNMNSQGHIYPVYLSGYCPEFAPTDNNDAQAELDSIKRFIDKRINSTIKIGEEIRKPAERVICKDGFSVSIQAGWGIYSEPRCSADSYSAYELGFPSEHDGILVPYQERIDDCRQVDAIFPYTPASIVTHLILKHGGLDHQAMREKAEL